MNSFLRQATASQSRTIGPFIDNTDFITPLTGLTIANTDIKIQMNGGASSNKNSGGGTARTNGTYGVTFDATDTATVGEMAISVVVSGALIVWAYYTVLEEAVYDALYAASAPGYVVDQPVNTTKFGGTTVTGRDIGLSVLLSSGTGTGQILLSSGKVVVPDTQKVDIETIKTNPVVNGGTVTFPTTATLASTTNITAGTITTATNLTNSPTAGDFTATMKTSLNAATPNVTVSDKTGFSLSTAGILAIWHQLTSAIVTAGTIGKLIVDNLDAAITSRMATYTQPTGFLAATFPSVVASTTNITTAALGATERNAIADAYLARNVAGGSSTGRTVKQVNYATRNKTEIAGGTLTVYEVDDTTPSWDATVTTAAGNPISSIDPS